MLEITQTQTSNNDAHWFVVYEPWQLNNEKFGDTSPSASGEESVHQGCIVT